MSILVAKCDELRVATQANLILVHHTGKDATRGMRGSTNLPGAVDTAIFLQRIGSSAFQASDKANQDGSGGKQRGSAQGNVFRWTLEVVTFEQKADDGSDITTVVVKPFTDDEEKESAPEQRRLAKIPDKLRQPSSRFAKRLLAMALLCRLVDTFLRKQSVSR